MTIGEYQAIVVGNGLIGSAAARHLSERGQHVAVIGPREPADAATDGVVFASHYDQGRLCSRLGRDPVLATINRRAVDQYGEIEARSGVAFHRGVGWLKAVRLNDDERDGLRRWIAEMEEEHGVSIRHFEPGDRTWHRDAPMLQYPDSHDIVIEPGPAGYINPRQLLAAQNRIAEANGAAVIERLVVGVHAGPDGVSVTTDDGADYTADRVLVAAGAFTNFNDLLPEPIPLRYKTESTIWADVAPAEAERLRSMPVASYDIDDPVLDDIYLAPPVRYPDGVDRIKMGCNTASEAWPTTLEEIQAWFRSDGPGPEHEAMERALRAQLPSVAIETVTSHRCIVTYTPSGYPTIDAAPGATNGRLFVATGGNGGGAQGSDTLGWLAAGLLDDGHWAGGVAREPFLASHRWGETSSGRSKAQDRAADRP